jgi:hypothetical protein
MQNALGRRHPQCLLGRAIAPQQHCYRSDRYRVKRPVDSEGSERSAPSRGTAKARLSTAQRTTDVAQAQPDSKADLVFQTSHSHLLSSTQRNMNVRERALARTNPRFFLLGLGCTHPQPCPELLSREWSRVIEKRKWIRGFACFAENIHQVYTKIHG